MLLTAIFLTDFLTCVQDKTLRENDLTALRKQIEREYQEKVSLEDQIMERLRTQLTLDKAALYSKKLTGRTRDHTKNLVSKNRQMDLILPLELAV